MGPQWPAASWWSSCRAIQWLQWRTGILSHAARHHLMPRLAASLPRRLQDLTANDDINMDARGPSGATPNVEPGAPTAAPTPEYAPAMHVSAVAGRLVRKQRAQ